MAHRLVIAHKTVAGPKNHRATLAPAKTGRVEAMGHVVTRGGGVENRAVMARAILIKVVLKATGHRPGMIIGMMGQAESAVALVARL